MSSRLWAYNYNFEFELANQNIFYIGNAQQVPWWFLNRSAALYIPLTQKNDSILTYQRPHCFILQQLQRHFNNLPRFILVASFSKETNCVINDFKRNANNDQSFQEQEFSPWGWSPQAHQIAEKYFNNRFPSNFNEITLKANSKQTSDHIRTNLLAQSFQIPSLQIVDKKLSIKSLESAINGFLTDFLKVKIKHYFGASGRLSDTIQEKITSSGKLNVWHSWIQQSGGILLEKVLEIDSEYSIQAELDKTGATKILTFTRMFSNRNGSYLGNLIDSSKSDTLISLQNSFKPLFSYLAEIGYQGPVGLDLLKSKDGEFKLIEINARITMGRIAYEWNRAINQQQFGFFANFFAKGNQFRDIHSLQELCLSLEKRFNCIISIINAIPSIQRPISLITIFVGAKTKNFITKILSEIYPSLFQTIKF